MPPRRVGVLGATSLVADFLLPDLAASGWEVAAFSRRGAPALGSPLPNTAWYRFSTEGSQEASDGRQAAPIHATVTHWISLAPIDALITHLPLLEFCGAQRLIALSSTSRFTKARSPDPAERQLASRLAAGEAALTAWAEHHGVDWILIRPTLIYGAGRDHNVSTLARFIRRFGFFPIYGAGTGHRQPLHASDVSAACQRALTRSELKNKAYTICGGETLTYREMVERIFAAVGRRPRFLPLGSGWLRPAVFCMRCLPRFRQLTMSVFERMNQDLTFDSGEAMLELGFAPKPFDLIPRHWPPEPRPGPSGRPGSAG